MITPNSEKLLVQSFFEEYLGRPIDPSDQKFFIQRLTGDASTRRYYRIKHEKQYVACIDQAFIDGNNPFLVVQKIFEEHDIRVPHIYFQRADRGFILEEDLGDITFLSQIAKVEDVNVEKEFYNKAISLLIKIHKIPLENYSGTSLTQLVFDKAKLMSEVELAIQHFLIKLCGCKEDDKKIADIRIGFDAITEKLSKGPFVATHRDYHSRNLMIKNDELIVIDFQDARRGLPQYDLVSLLEDCYYSINAETRWKLVQQYYSEIGKDYFSNYSDFEYIYDLSAIQRIFKAIGSFSYIFATRQDHRYLKYIGGAMERLRGFLVKYRDYDSLRLALTTIYYES
jgi:aminoglycoside/choline kinase family phosphotransferase